MLLTGNEHRGNDATGMALAQKDGVVHVFKRDIPAWQFVCSKEYKKFLEENLTEETWAAILHTRAATQGSPRDNNNNHPLFAGKCAAIHNGIIHNDDQMFKTMKLDRKAETDSDIIRAIADEHGLTTKCMTELNRLSGSAAGAIISPEYPERMILFRSGSPMSLASSDNFFVFSSEKNTIHRAMRPMVERFGAWFQANKPDFDFAPMADNTAWLIGPKGVELHKEFKSLGAKYVEPFRRTYTDYKQRQEAWDKRQEQKATALATKKDKKDWDEAWCAACNTPWVVPKGTKPEDFFCGSKEKHGCGTRLTARPKKAQVN
jgi:predicted glutamine amidotransferase